MKSKLIWLIVVLIVVAGLFGIVGNKGKETAEFKPLEINLGDAFTYLNYDGDMFVLNYAMEDVTGDGTKDMIIIIGEIADAEKMEYKAMDIVVFEPNTGNFYSMKLKKWEGQLPKIFTYDVTGDGVLDVIGIVQRDGLQMRIGTYLDGEWKEIFKQRDNKGITFFGEFQDGFKASVKCVKYNKEANIDLQDRKDNYIANKFYDEAGRLLKTEESISTTGFKTIDFVQLDNCYGIQTTQNMIGFEENDLMDEISCIWKYENGKWNAKEAKGMYIGNILY